MVTKDAASKWKSLLRKHRQDDLEQKPTNCCTATRPISQVSHRQRLSFAEKYCKTQKTLGEDDNRSVFVALRKSDQHCVAVKRFERRQDRKFEDDYSEKVVAEYWIGSQLTHENIIQNVDLVRDDNGLWLQIMEYAPFNLFDRVGSPQMSAEEIDCAFAQIASGVNYMHQSGFAHRDLKLENIVYTQSGIMKIIDFGVATITRRDSKMLPLCNEYVGSRPYIAPEIIYRKAYDPQSTDVWSLAIMLCCMVLRRFPWKEASHNDRQFAEFVRLATTQDRAPVRRTKTSEENVTVTSLFTKNDQEHRKDVAICAVVEVSSERKATPTTPKQLSQHFSEAAWAVVREMLQVDSRKRPVLKQILNSAWIKSTQTCSKLKNDEERDSCAHKHT